MNTLSASWPQRSQPDPWPRAYEWWRLASVGCVLVPWEALGPQKIDMCVSLCVFYQKCRQNIKVLSQNVSCTIIFTVIKRDVFFENDRIFGGMIVFWSKCFWIYILKYKIRTVLVLLHRENGNFVLLGNSMWCIDHYGEHVLSLLGHKSISQTGFQHYQHPRCSVEVTHSWATQKSPVTACWFTKEPPAANLNVTCCWLIRS